jgi:uncharacterized protein YqjF (DUF2071 family)
MHPALRTTDHRPWPLPERQWTWRQSWLDIAFIHLRVDAKKLRTRLPPGVRLQEFDGTAWVSLVPFRMAGVTRRPFPPVPGFSSFPELNLRTYIEVDHKPGVWFFSLDADAWPVIFAGRRIYDLPYFSARVRQTFNDGWFAFSSARRASDARFAGRYRPSGPTFFAQPGTFDHWATERYCLYTFSIKRGLTRIEVHHAPWPLQDAEVEITEHSVFSAAGIETLGEHPICHFSAGVHAIAFGKESPVVATGP